MKKVIYIFIVVSFIFYSFFAKADTGRYYSIPPFITEPVKPNVILLMDFSGSMQFPAYYACYTTSFSGYYNKKVAQCNTDEIKANYDFNYDYYGIFNSNKYYKYDSNKNYFIDNTKNCNYKDKIGSQPNCISGNLLNFVTTTRIDAALKALIGGRAECDSNYCYLEAQGSYRNVEVSNINCEFTIKPQIRKNGNYNEKKILLSSDDYNGSCPVGGLNNVHVVLKIDKDNRTGIVQNNFNKVRFTFMVFGGNREGVIRYGFNEDNLTYLVDKIQSETPYSGTPTGEAMREVSDYLKQENNYSYEKNSNYIHKGSVVDPYYQKLPNGSIVPTWCRKSYVVLISDGEWNGNVDPVKPSYYLHTEDLRHDLKKKQIAKIFSIFMFDNSAKGKNSMKTISTFGSFNDVNSCTQNWPYTFYDFPNNSKNVTWPRNNCNPRGNYNNCCKEWDSEDLNGIPDTYYQASNGKELSDDLTKVFSEIFKAIASGTAASVLSEKERVNAGIIQAAFYPQKTFTSGTSSNTVNWVGSLYDWWFLRVANNIREDTITNKDLDICTNGQPGGDYIIDYSFEDNKLKIKGYKSTCSGQKASSTADVTYDGLEDAHFVWSAGKALSETEPDDRTIYTYVGNLKPDSEKDLEALKDVDNTPTKKFSELFGDDNGDENIIIDNNSSNIKYVKFADLKNYIYGTDEGCVIYNTQDNNTECRSRNIGDNETWKLGDIIYSTPKIVNYDNYSVAFVGANDGMLHAFLVGKYRYDGLGPYQFSKLRNSSFSNDTNDLGKELWAFIPKNILPYLRFLADPDYCHMYFVDLTPYIIEIKDRWGNIEKRILIGGMRLGGAVGSDNSTVSVNPPKDTCPTPSNYNSANDPSTPTKGCLGLSSYFALDITNPIKPKFLWEFTNPKLGFSYSGPAFITIKDSSGQKHYYVMFTSGPTDYKGDVGQDLTTFILTLNSSYFTIENVYPKDLSSSLGLGYAFGGRLFTNGIDKDNNGTTDLLFEGVVQYDNGDWKGNVIGIRPDDANPANWDFFKLFNNPIGPVVAPVSYEKCFNKKFIYFGSGRYFSKDDTPNGTRERLYGIEIDNCFNENCSITNLVSSSSACSNIGSIGYGWYQDLLAAGDGYNKERDITTPTTTKENVIYFTTTQPTSDICGFGGRSRLWGLNCATGESLGTQECSNYITGSIVGTLLLQTSIGEISKFDVNIVPNTAGGSNPFTQEGGKATEWKTGTSSPNPSNYIPPTIKQPAEILYEIEN